MTIRALLLAVLAASPATTFAQEMQVRAACRDGLPHGAYELREAGGQLRVAGAFNRGKRAGSFIFWTTDGTRVAHIPFDDDRQSGTLSLWYAKPSKGGDSRSKLQAEYAAGKRNGISRSWHPNGRARTEFVYANDALVEARAWHLDGKALTDRAARALATRDSVEDEKYYASLFTLVASHLPSCAGTPPAATGTAS